MAVHKCPDCGTEYSNKKKLRACIFSHLAEQEDSTPTTNPTDGELLTDEEELEEEEQIEDAIAEAEEHLEEDDGETPEQEEQRAELQEAGAEPDAEFYMKKPVVVQAYQTPVEKKIETLEGTMTANPGDWIITGVAGEQYPCKPEIFEKTYERCDGEIKPVIIPRRLCPKELEYLATEQLLTVKVQGVLTKNYEIDVKDVEFIRR